MTLEQIKQSMAASEWVSIACEVRPSIAKNADGSAKPFYLKRDFTYHADDRFELVVTNMADPYGKAPLVSMRISGHMLWLGSHPIAEGAQKVDFIADNSYEVTPLHQGFADAMNQSAANGYEAWKVNGTQSILRKGFAPFGLSEGQVFSECDLVYLFNDMLFWGARHVDGRGFNKEENRPSNLQIPLARKTAR